MKAKLFSTQSAIPYSKGLPEGCPDPLFLLLGGFLGAGKTSFLRKYAHWLTEKGLKVGMVANDQAGGLVDAERFRLNGAGRAMVAEVTGGCFCCKLDDLVERLAGLNKAGRPDVILAEPVGSCTDLVATVVRPLQEIYAFRMSLAPYAVLVDGLGLLGTGNAFSPDVAYILGKQLEEADMILVNKVDLLSAKQRAAVSQKLAADYPGKDVRFVSVHTGAGLEEVFGLLLAAPRRDRLGDAGLAVDYDRYAAGEALLGWYNAELSVHGVKAEFEGNRWLLWLGKTVVKSLLQVEPKLKIAHLKLSLEWRGGAVATTAKKVPEARLAVVQVVSNGQKLSFSQNLSTAVLVGRLLVNIRAEGNAKRIQVAVRQAINDASVLRSVRVVWRDEAAFQPGRPVPVHRIA